MNISTIRTTMLLMLTLSIVAVPVTGYNSSTSGDLDGTSWQLVKFEGSEGTMLVPASDRSSTRLLLVPTAAQPCASTAIAEVVVGNIKDRTKSNLALYQ